MSTLQCLIGCLAYTRLASDDNLTASSTYSALFHPTFVLLASFGRIESNVVFNRFSEKHCRIIQSQILRLYYYAGAGTATPSGTSPIRRSAEALNRAGGDVLGGDMGVNCNLSVGQARRPMLHHVSGLNRTVPEARATASIHIQCRRDFSPAIFGSFKHACAS